MLTETVYERIRTAILSAELRPNRRLVESDLAESLKVSRTPVREALLRLEQEGFVKRSRGWVVREYQPSEIRERLECRLAIEGYAAGLAASRVSEAVVEELRGLAAAMAELRDDRLAFNALNDTFHRIITDAAGNPTLSSLHAQTKMKYWDLNVPVTFSAEEDEAVVDQHRGLVEALEAGDGERAERLARTHVQLTMDVIVAELAKRYGGPRPTSSSA